MIAEMPHKIQQIGSGTRSSISSQPGDGSMSSAVVTRTGALTAGTIGAVRSGCVFAIFTVALIGFTGSGLIVIRAVSFRGPAIAPEPG